MTRNVYFFCLLAAGLLIFMLFKNIQYPLFWNDESDTVVFAQRILQFGYPKVYDGKNISNHFLIFHPELSVKKKSNVYIGSTWGNYYFAAPWVFIGSLIDDMYLKTGIIRSAYAVAGLVGLGIILLASLSVVDKEKKGYFILAFLLLEATSVFLILNLRQARTQALVLLPILGSLGVYLSYKVLQTINFRAYLFYQLLILWVIFQVFYPAYFIMIIYFLFNEASEIYAQAKNGYKKVLRNIISSEVIKVCLISLLMVAPFVYYFEIFRISRQIAIFFNYNFFTYIRNLILAVSYFIFLDNLLLVIVTKILMKIFLPAKTFTRNSLITKRARISGLLFSFTLIYLAVFSGSPAIYMRYYLVLQPVLAVILLLDFLSLEYYRQKFKPRNFHYQLSIPLIVVFTISALRFSYVPQYMHEIFNQYQGPLDNVIPYLASKYEHPSELIIATNYEEQSYMYYLGSHTIVGYIGNNLPEDLRFSPDVIIPRKYVRIHLKEVRDFLKQGDYIKKQFEIADYPFNNIPELFFSPIHLFESPVRVDKKDRLEIYEKSKSSEE